jgi:DNA-binding transcriptional LysR family regulator
MARKYDLSSLELFVAVCEYKSITQVAELHNITASAISKRITRLEEFAGTPLLIRTNSGVAPTNEGARLLEHARNLLYNVELLERDLGSGAANRRGGLLIVANRSANAELVPASVASFLADPKHRNLDVQIGEMTSHEVVSRVKGGLATLGVCWAETDMAGVEWKPGKRDHLSAVVPKCHPLANKERIAFADTLEYEQVGIYLGGPVTHLLRRESVRTGKPLRYRIMAPTFDAMIRVVESGLVVAIMPAAVALRYARGSPIAVIPLTDAWRERQFAVCCRSRRALPSPAAELFGHLVSGVDDPSPQFPPNR